MNQTLLQNPPPAIWVSESDDSQNSPVAFLMYSDHCGLEILVSDQRDITSQVHINYLSIHKDTLQGVVPITHITFNDARIKIQTSRKHIYWIVSGEYEEKQKKTIIPFALDTFPYQQRISQGLHTIVRDIETGNSKEQEEKHKFLAQAFFGLFKNDAFINRELRFYQKTLPDIFTTPIYKLH